ncbi:hypothetical protein GCM10020220_000330 [Nonomuraea rubra]|uniref:hypothetical protein n=1 Tax=Nonomuraea rubra TaxID=46180 RepID=UPI0031E8A814
MTTVGDNGEADYFVAAYDTADGKEKWQARYDGPGKGTDDARVIELTPDGTRLFVSGQSQGEEGTGPVRLGHGRLRRPPPGSSSGRPGRTARRTASTCLPAWPPTPGPSTSRAASRRRTPRATVMTIAYDVHHRKGAVDRPLRRPRARERQPRTT